MEWTPDLAVGVRELDDEHHEIVRRIDALLAALKRPAEGAVGRAVTSLHDYAVFHFHNEERQMVASDFPGYLMHRAVHLGFVDELERWARRLEEKGGAAALAGDLEVWLDAWMQTHFTTLDRELGAHLAKRGGNTR